MDRDGKGGKQIEKQNFPIVTKHTKPFLIAGELL